MSLHPRRSLAAALAAGALAAAAPAARADVLTFGSELSATANVTEARQADTLYWQTRFAGGASPLAPADGQIKTVRLKGIALSNPVAGVPGGETMWHLQVLHRQADGTFKILRTSQAFYVPHSGDPQQITTYKPENLCVDKGDVVAFNTVGGWDGIMEQGGPYPSGTPLQIFSRVPGALVSQYTGADLTNNGDVVRADTTRGADHELLMQMTVGTGADAVIHCPGGTWNPYREAAVGDETATASLVRPPQKVTIPKQHVTVSRKGKLTIALFCQPGAGSCAGTVQVLSRRRSKLLAGRRFTIAPKTTGKVSLTLGRVGRRLFKSSGSRLPVKIVTVTTPGGADRTVTGTFTLRRRGAR